MIYLPGTSVAGLFYRILPWLPGSASFPVRHCFFSMRSRPALRALMALRYLYEEAPDLHVVAAGSLMEFALSAVSFPVGRVRFLNMYPMTFAEFLAASGQEQLAEVLQKPPVRLDDVVHRLLLNRLREYFFVGGMPEAVRGPTMRPCLCRTPLKCSRKFWIPTGRILRNMRPRADKTCLDRALVGCAAKVGEQVKYSRLVEGFSNPTIHKAFDLLCRAKVINRIPSVKTPGLPLGASVNNKKFKASLLDIGLMQRLNHLPVDIEIRQRDLLNIYRGKLAEQFVAPGVACGAKR